MCISLSPTYASDVSSIPLKVDTPIFVEVVLLEHWVPIVATFALGVHPWGVGLALAARSRLCSLRGRLLAHYSTFFGLLVVR